jgi:hypothetical protein
MDDMQRSTEDGPQREIGVPVSSGGGADAQAGGGRDLPTAYVWSKDFTIRRII